MKLFASYDNTFCDNEKCKISNNCKRYIKHYGEAVLKHPRLSILLVEDEEKCNNYIKVD